MIVVKKIFLITIVIICLVLIYQNSKPQTFDAYFEDTIVSQHQSAELVKLLNIDNNKVALYYTESDSIHFPRKLNAGLFEQYEKDFSWVRISHIEMTNENWMVFPLNQGNFLYLGYIENHTDIQTLKVGKETAEKKEYKDGFIWYKVVGKDNNPDVYGVRSDGDKVMIIYGYKK